jgi:hypothetical protein
VLKIKNRGLKIKTLGTNMKSSMIKITPTVMNKDLWEIPT